MATTKQMNLNQGKVVRWGILAFLLFILFVMLTNTTFITIDPGHKGVLFKRFAGGLKVEKIYNQGFHVVAPWNKMFVYDVRTQEHFEGMEVLSKNGLNIKIDLTIRFQPEPAKIGYLHDEIGVDYLSRIIQPEIRSATREVIGKYLPEELYSSKREAIQDEIYTRTAASIAEKHIYLDAVLIRSVILPQSLQAAIERKLKEEQTMLEYDYKLQKELKEKERMIIEANAKSESNLILNASLTEKILRDKGIEATLELAKSPNSKVVIVGSGDDGLPLILGN